MDMTNEAQHPIEAQPDGDTSDWVPPRYVPCGRHGCLLCVPIVDADDPRDRAPGY